LRLLAAVVDLGHYRTPRILCGQSVLRRRGPEIADLPRSCVLIRGDRRGADAEVSRFPGRRVAEGLAIAPHRSATMDSEIAEAEANAAVSAASSSPTARRRSANSEPKAACGLGLENGGARVEIDGSFDRRNGELAK
jgi:hypothetical protein